MKIGQKLTARRAGAANEQSYDQGVVTKIGRDGVFYTGYPGDKTSKKWTPNPNYNGHYKMTMSYAGRKMPAVDCVDLVFSE